MTGAGDFPKQDGDTSYPEDVNYLEALLWVPRTKTEEYFGITQQTSDNGHVVCDNVNFNVWKTKNKGLYFIEKLGECIGSETSITSFKYVYPSYFGASAKQPNKEMFVPFVVLNGNSGHYEVRFEYADSTSQTVTVNETDEVRADKVDNPNPDKKIDRVEITNNSAGQSIYVVFLFSGDELIDAVEYKSAATTDYVLMQTLTLPTPQVVTHAACCVNGTNPVVKTIFYYEDTTSQEQTNHTYTYDKYWIFSNPGVEKNVTKVEFYLKKASDSDSATIYYYALMNENQYENIVDCVDIVNDNECVIQGQNTSKVVKNLAFVIYPKKYYNVTSHDNTELTATFQRNNTP